MVPLRKKKTNRFEVRVTFRWHVIFINTVVSMIHIFQKKTLNESETRLIVLFFAIQRKLFLYEIKSQDEQAMRLMEVVTPVHNNT